MQHSFKHLETLSSRQKLERGRFFMQFGMIGASDRQADRQISKCI